MKKLHSFLATLLVFSIIFSMFSTVSFVSAETNDTWNGKIATEFAGGDGTSANPFLIENGAQLAKAVTDKGLNNGAAAYYLITNDLYLNDDYANYKSWGTNAPANNWGVTYSGSAFSGYLDGGYHTIYGMYYSRGGSYAGLIAYVSGTGATICNLTIANSYVNNTAGNTTAVFVGRLDNGTVKNCIARDCYLTNKDNKTMAGIAAWSNTSTSKITNCGAYGLTFSSGAATVGGILAQSNGGNATVSSCFSGGTFIFGNTGNIACSTSYTDIDAAWKNGVTELVDGSMKGSGAVAKMGLSATIWKDTDGYPTLIGNGTKGEAWSGATAAWFAGGKGTEADPFLIETGEQLHKAVKDLGKYAGASAYYLITADIILNEGYENYADWATTAPAKNWGSSYSGSSFSGNLDGGYHTVYGMYYSAGGSYAGLVAYLSGTGAKISNLIISNSYVNNTAGNTTAVFVGRLDNGTVKNCIARDCYLTNKDNKTMAGIAAWSNTATSVIENCAAYGLTFSSGAATIGGILAQSNGGNATVKGCFSGGTFIFGNTGNIACSTSYTDIDAAWKNGVSNKSETPEVMQGADAVTNMANLTAGIWKATETYPTFALNNGTKGEVWSGAKAARYTGGSGTAEDPYIIETAEQLYKAVAELGVVNSVSAHYLITEDIYLNENYANYLDWATTAPANNWGVAYSGSAFSGYLDGGNHTIYGMYYSKGGSYAGLIAYLSGTGATICNLTIANAYVNNTSSNSTAVFAGRLDNGTISNCIARDCYLTNKDNKTMAGIAAWSNTSTSKIINCGAYGLTFSSGAATVGGILAQSNNGNATVINCYSAGTYIFGNTGNISCTHSYTDIDAAWKNGVKELLTESAMVGENAAVNMQYLDFINVWQTVENGYPVLRKESDNNLNQKIAASYSIKHSNNEWVVFNAKVDMPKINPINDDNISITIDGVKKVVREVGVIISRKGFETTDITTVANTPLTGYKIVGYTNGADNSALVKVGGQIEITAIVNGTVDYTAKTYIVFADDSVVLGDVYDAEPSTETVTIESGVEINDLQKSGDANFDGVINLKDIVRFKKYAADADVNKGALSDVLDMNGDADFDATDISNLRKELLAEKEVAPVSSMELVFEDNFDTLNLDTNNKWDFTDYMQGYGVETADTSDVQSIQREEDGNGFLRLTSYKTADGKYKATKSISTGNKLTFVHGYLEIRAKVPTVQGAWPSLWLKSNTKNTNLGWKNDFPYNTEVDVFEVMGGNRAISELHKWQYVAETGVTNDIRYGQKRDRNSYAITDNDWHTYGMLWTDDEIVISVDGVAIQTYNLNKDFEIKWPWDKGLGMDGFKNQPLCITLNNYLFTPEYTNSEAGSWAKGLAVADDFTESVYDIDYVRLYQDKTDANTKLYKAN